MPVTVSVGQQGSQMLPRQCVDSYCDRPAASDLRVAVTRNGLAIPILGSFAAIAPAPALARGR